MSYKMTALKMLLSIESFDEIPILNKKEIKEKVGFIDLYCP